MTQRRYGLVEAGGTKFVLGTATGPDALGETCRIDTTTPAETMAAMLDWFRTQGPLDGIGIASFGPLELDKTAPNWGHITATPKPGWSHIDLAGPLARAFACPVAIDTDVNGAALAESLWGAGTGQRVSLYYTIGTGVGGGAVIDGKVLHGVSHPEMGHFYLPRHHEDMDFAGHCSFHGGCLEGLASGPAIMARWGQSLSDLPADHPGKRIIAWYLAQMVCTIQAVFEPGRIILGGGVTATPGLIDLVRAQADVLGAGYFRGKASEIIVPPGLGDKAGLLGALALILGAVASG